MARNKSEFICQNCGQIHKKWVGRCEGCQSWNSLLEESSHNSGIGSGFTRKSRQGTPSPLLLLAEAEQEAERLATGLGEFDRVTGNGLVKGAVILIGGDPGIGKSTLLTQSAALLSYNGYKSLYVSGEEAPAQISLRAKRLRLADSGVILTSETNLEDIIATLKKAAPLDLVIIDSIQTLWSDQLDAAPGTVTQVRSCAQALIHFAKKYNSTVILIGHVTKDGQLAGPRVVEHMVDTVLYFEGERNHHYRILRAMKNRFGPTDEIGIFEMSDSGLKEVANPSQLFLDGRTENANGVSVFAGIEGTRPLLSEIQSLVAPSSLGNARRAVVGWDSSRLAMILAVLEAHCRLKFSQYDVYLNVAGGLRINEPAADLAVAASLLSSLYQKALCAKTIFFGEISLSSHLRPVSRSLARLKEAQKLGFEKAILPYDKKQKTQLSGFDLISFNNLPELNDYIKKL